MDLAFLQNFWCGDVDPGIDSCKRLMVRHVTLQWRHRNIAPLDSVVISAVRGARTKIFFPNPEVGLAARVYVFRNYRPRVFDSLTRNQCSFYLSGGNVDVEKSPFRQ